MLPGLRNKPLLSRLKLTDLSASVQSLINGALQRSGGTMLADIILAGNTAQARARCRSSRPRASQQQQRQMH